LENIVAHIVLDCPHCLAQAMTMNVVSRAKTREGYGIAFAQCGRCIMPVTAIVGMSHSTIEHWIINPGNDVLADSQATLITVIPDPKKSAAPAHVEKDVARVFVQAEDARRRQELDNAGMAYRKTLDIALKKFDGALKGSLYERIDTLAARHDITAAMQEWAHQVRLIGNDANHEDQEPRAPDIEAIAAFTETLLKYLFTLPAEVKARKPSNATP
jgi:hypothetical protein